MNSSAPRFVRLAARALLALVPAPSMLGTAVMAAAVLSLGATAGAQPARLGRPPVLEAVAEPEPELEAEEWSRRAWLLEVSGGPTLGLCPEGQAQCSARGGWQLSALAQSRPLPNFSWGPFFQQAAHSERYSGAAWDLTQHTESSALGLAGRLWMYDTGRFDPYVQVAAGLGHVQRSGTLLSEQDTLVREASAEGQSTDAVPLYAVSAGLAVQLTPGLRLGGELMWSHWLISQWERCPVLSGVCVTPPLRSYDPHNGVLSIGLSIGVSFGSRL